MVQRLRFEDIGEGKVQVDIEPSDYLLTLSYEEKINTLTIVLETLKSDLENYENPYYVHKFNTNHGGEIKRCEKTTLELQILFIETLLFDLQEEELNSQRIGPI
jgi:hypothetical protein